MVINSLESPQMKENLQETPNVNNNFYAFLYIYFQLILIFQFSIYLSFSCILLTFLSNSLFHLLHPLIKFLEYYLTHLDPFSPIFLFSFIQLILALYSKLTQIICSDLTFLLHRPKL